MLGAVEKVQILPWGLTLDARVDNGAAKSSMAAVDLRVRGKEVEICLAGQRLRTLLDLDDRTGLKYPMLLGRETLRGRFLVDVGRMHLHPQPCFGAKGGEGRSPETGEGGPALPLSPLEEHEAEETSPPAPKTP